MVEENKKFHFEFSLEVLNHLGRGLYRSFATVVAEAISNSWDAEATEVKITIKDDKLIVEDNGKGMNDSDFQDKFLKVGYSRRADKENKSKRKVIGRKGIGKLAMLSISEKVTILSKRKSFELTGGRINNPELDKQIKQDKKYSLENLTKKEKEKLFGKNNLKRTGTKIIFEKIKTNLNSEDIIRKYVATQFNFIFSLKRKDKFYIKVNNKLVTVNDLKELNDNTQFIWYLNHKKNNFEQRYKNIKKDRVIDKTNIKFQGKNFEINGFVASVEKPNQLILNGSKGDFKAGVNLFANGRLRQENVFEEIARKTVAEEYLYGEIHVDGLDDTEIDRFTSSREGIIKDDSLYQEFLKELNKILNRVIQDWTPWRNDLKQEGDIDQDSRPPYEVRMGDSSNKREKDFRDKIDDSIKDPREKKILKEKLKELSYKNTLVYQDLFILENIFREYIKMKGIKESDLDESIPEEATIKKTIKDVRDCRKHDEERHALKGKIAKNDHYLNHLYLFELGDIIDCKINKINEQQKKHRKPLESDTKEILPVRNTVMHTVEITENVRKWDKIKNVIDYVERLSDKLKNKTSS